MAYAEVWGHGREADIYTLHPQAERPQICVSYPYSLLGGFFESVPTASMQEVQSGKRKGGTVYSCTLYPVNLDFMALSGSAAEIVPVIANLLSVHEEMGAILFHLKLLRICVSLFNTVVFHHFICTLHCSFIQLMHAVKEGMRSFM